MAMHFRKPMSLRLEFYKLMIRLGKEASMARWPAQGGEVYVVKSLIEFKVMAKWADSCITFFYTSSSRGPRVYYVILASFTGYSHTFHLLMFRISGFPVNGETGVGVNHHSL